MCGDIDRSEGDIHMNAHIFDNQLKKYYYYRSTSTVVFLDHVGKVWKSHDNGETWIEETHDGAPLPAVVAIHADEYRPNRMFYITLSTEVFYSNDNGTKLYKFDAKLPPNGLREMILRTHYSKEDYLLWTGAKDCDSLFSACHTETFFSRSMGVNWDSVRTYTRGCTFGQTGDYRKPTEDAIYCINSEQTGDQRYSMIGNLEMSLDIGKTWSKQIEGVLGFAIVNEFLVAAQIVS